MSRAYGLCPLGCGATAGDIDGPHPANAASSHKYPGVLVRLDTHHVPGNPQQMCIGSHQYVAPLPVAAPGKGRDEAPQAQ